MTATEIKESLARKLVKIHETNGYVREELFACYKNSPLGDLASEFEDGEYPLPPEVAEEDIKAALKAEKESTGCRIININGVGVDLGFFIGGEMAFCADEGAGDSLRTFVEHAKGVALALGCEIERIDVSVPDELQDDWNWNDIEKIIKKGQGEKAE
jgi:hypothetical protein